jgi:hypothetical protein
MEINYDWSEEITCSLTKELLSSDMLGRVKYAEYLTTYLKQYKNESYVFNINSSWGSGKTYFIKRWANSLQEKHPVIYFNSWKFDHNNEPLILILSEVIQQLNDLVSDPEKKELKQSLAKSVTQTMKHIAPTLSKGIFKKISGVNWDDLSEDTEQSAEDKDNIKLGGELVSVSTKALLNLHVEQQNSIEDLKGQVSEILSTVLTIDNADNTKRWSPMYVFIDELDRCRPTFAIEVLEVIKHIFDIPRIIFVIATDTEQLQHSIKAVYGHDFDAEKYLMRFFNRSFALPTPILKDFINQLSGIELIKERLVKTSSFNIFEIDDKGALRFIAMIFEGVNLDLRSVDQIIERVSSILVNHEGELGVVLLLVLECIRTKQQSAFDNLWSKRIHSHGTGENQLSFFIQSLVGVREESLIELESSSNINKSTYIDNLNDFSKLHNGKTVKLSSIIHFLVMQVNPSTQININSNEYNMQTAYYLESLGNNTDIIRFKDYVELASNLS